MQQGARFGLRRIVRLMPHDSHGTVGLIGVPVAAVRTLPEALAANPEVIVDAGAFRLIRSPIQIDGYEPDYGAPPRLDEHGGANLGVL